MKKTIRLYRRHDMDLLVLYKHPDFAFQKVLRDALRAYVRREPFIIYQPDMTKDLSNFDFKYGYQCFLYLDDTEDADVIEWLRGVKQGMVNELIKCILRGCLIGPAVFACIKSDDERIASNELMEKIKAVCIGADEAPLKGKAKPKPKLIKEQKKTSITEEKPKSIKPPTKKKKVVVDSDDTPKSSRTTPKHEENAFEEKENFGFDGFGDSEEESEDNFDLFGGLDAMLTVFQ